MRYVAAVILLALFAATVGATRLRAPDGGITNVPDESVEYALRDGYERVPCVWMRDDAGTPRCVYEDYVSGQVERGWWKMTAAEVSDRHSKEMEAQVGKLVEEYNAKERHERNVRWLAIGGGIIALVVVLAGFNALSKRRKNSSR